MKISIETIHPNLASEFLTRNVSNRAFSQHTAEKYAKAMLRGEWVCNGESIVFDTNNNLANGQHRLRACVASGVPLTTVVVLDAPVEAFKTFDIGKTRNGSDILSIRGEKNTILLAAAARGFLKLELVGRERFEITPTQIDQAVLKHPNLRTWTNEYVKFSPRLYPGTFVGVVSQVDRHHGNAMASKFFSKAVTGTGLAPGDPEALLRDKFINKRFGMSLSTEMQLAFIIKCANASILGKSMKLLKVSVDEAFPVLLGVR